MSTLKSPEELNEPSFTLESNLELSDLIQISKCLLSYLSSKLKQLFYLVVFFKEKACFRLCLDTSLWFDIYLHIIPDFAEAVRIVKDYVTTTRLNVSPEDEAPFIIDYKETEKDTKHLIFVYTFLTVNLLKKSVVSMKVKKIFVLPIMLIWLSSTNLILIF